jgi:deoxycytidylate deaminase
MQPSKETVITVECADQLQTAHTLFEINHKRRNKPDDEKSICLCLHAEEGGTHNLVRKGMLQSCEGERDDPDCITVSVP